MKNRLIEKDILVRFADADPQGILYHSRVYEIAHSLLEEYWSTHKLGWNFWFKNPSFAVPLRHTECDFLAPLKAGERYLATLTVAELGESSVAFVCEIGPKDGEPGARVKTVHVFVDRQSFKKTAIPQEIRTALT